MISVLYYDRDPAWRERARLAAAQAGDLGLTTFGTLEDVFAALQDDLPDAVVADPPYVEGAPLLSIVRQRCGPIPFILFLAPRREKEAIEFLNGGADRCVEKGNGDACFAELASTLRHMLAERTGAAALERRADQLEFLSRTAMDFVRMEDEADIYQYIADRVMECAPGAWVSVSSYDTAIDLFTVRSFAGSDHARRVFAEELPRPLVGTSYSLDGTPTAAVVLSCRTLTEAPPPFYLLCARTVPEEICARIDERLTLGRAYSMSFTCRGGVYGVVTFRFAKGMELENPGLIQAFIGQASVALLRRHARQRLLESETRYRAVVESQQELICRFAPDGTHRFENEAYWRFFGLDPTTMAGTRYRPDVPEQDRAALAAHFRGFAPERPDGTSEHRVCLPGGSVRWLRWHDRAFFDTDGVLVEYQSVGRDVTERKEAEEALAALTAGLEQRVEERTAELQAANRDLEAFTHSVSHDLRAPLRAIDGYLGLYMAKFGPDIPPDGVAMIGQARDGVYRAERFINGLLTLARVSRQEVKREPVDPAEIARSVIAELELAAGGRQVEYAVGEMPGCMADPILLRHVYQNLLANAIKFTRPREVATIACDAEAGADGTRYFVRDNGVGFAQADADRLFEPFARLHEARVFEGSGIGLALVKLIVERHGGSVWAEGAVDGGATFSFTLGSKAG